MRYTLDEFEVEGFEKDLEYVAGRAYEKTQFMAALVEEDFDGIIGMANCSNFFLIGPTGSGKSYLAQCFAQTALDNDYKVYQIDCEELMESDDARENWEKIFEEIIEKTDPDGIYDEKIFLYLENLDVVTEDRKSIKVIASSLKKINTMDCKCIVISTDLTGSEVPTAILKQFVIIELDKPDEMARIEFFKARLKIKLKIKEEFEDDEDGDENYSDKKRELVFFPLATGSEETRTNDPDYDELSVLALYCAEKTEGLTFGQLQFVHTLLRRKLKTILQRITDEDADAIKEHVESKQKAYLVSEEDFLEIISNVRKSAKILEQAEKVEKSGENAGAVSVVSQPQVVYAQPMPMPGGYPMPSGYPMPVGYPTGTSVNAEDAKLDYVQKVANDDNPMVQDLVKVVEMAQESIGTDDPDMGGIL